jgi:hypothetical protein
MEQFLTEGAYADDVLITGQSVRAPEEAERD